MTFSALRRQCLRFRTGSGALSSFFSFWCPTRDSFLLVRVWPVLWGSVRTIPIGPLRGVLDPFCDPRNGRECYAVGLEGNTAFLCRSLRFASAKGLGGSSFGAI